MNNIRRIAWLSLLLVASTSFAQSTAQERPYIGFAYPAGGQQGTTFRIKVGGQRMHSWTLGGVIDHVTISGTGVTGKLVEYQRRLSPEMVKLLNEQLSEVMPPSKDKPPTRQVLERMANPEMIVASTATAPAQVDEKDEKDVLIARIQNRLAEYQNRPAAYSIANLAYIEVTIASDAEPGDRELRISAPYGISNPLVFNIGQLPEVSRKALRARPLQVQGKESLALRERPADEVEDRVTIPCTMNGQIASGEINRYRFEARKGQRLVISVQARSLIPFLANAVPGWFQPVLTLYNAQGKEVAYDDDYRFKPDPVILFQVPEDGQYVCCIKDALFRGREDFVYRMTIGEVPFVTSIFPLGGRAGEALTVGLKGWNLSSTQLTIPAKDIQPGTHTLVTYNNGIVSNPGIVFNPMPYAIDTLQEIVEQEPNNDQAHSQKVELPVIINGRIDRPNDWDVYQFFGHAGDVVVAEVSARRLESPLDSMLKITDSQGEVLAVNDDYEDLAFGVNTHHADSYIMFKLPADGIYYVHVGDTARCGGEEYAYRLRISEPRPDFALRLAPSSASMSGKAAAEFTIYAQRKDGFDGSIKLGLKNPPPGFSVLPSILQKGQSIGKIVVEASEISMTPVTLTIEGRAKIQDHEVTRNAVPCEDRMQAFLWRNLVPTSDLQVLAFDPSYESPPKRTLPPKPKFTKQQTASLLKSLRVLYEERLITDSFYNKKVAESEASQ